MATFGEFASLLQLGVGFGIGVSLFRAPIEIRARRLSASLQRETDILVGVQTIFARQKRNQLMDLRLQFEQSRSELERHQLPFSVFAVYGAVFNLSCLVYASINPNRVADNIDQTIMIFFSVFYFLIIGGIVEIIARRKLGVLMEQFEDILRSGLSP